MFIQNITYNGNRYDPHKKNVRREKSDETFLLTINNEKNIFTKYCDVTLRISCNFKNFQEPCSKAKFHIQNQTNENPTYICLYLYSTIVN